MEEVAFCIFAAVVCFLYMKEVRRAREYGERLKNLRSTCSKVHSALVEGSVPAVNDYVSVVVRNKNGDVTFSKNFDTSNENELEFSKMSDKLEERRVKFVHHPDLIHMTHIVAVCKETNKKTEDVCLATMNT